MPQIVKSEWHKISSCEVPFEHFGHHVPRQRLSVLAREHEAPLAVTPKLTSAKSRLHLGDAISHVGVGEPVRCVVPIATGTINARAIPHHASR